jgi:hypothetical protein
MNPDLSSRDRKAILAELMSEYLFIVIPFTMLVLIKLYAYTWQEIVLSADWSLGSCIIFGQVAVKMTRSAIKHRSTDDRFLAWYASKRFFMVAVSLLFYFGMIALPTLMLGFAQFIVFGLASYFHFKDGVAARVLEAQT